MMATFQVRPPTDEFQAICSLTKSIFERENGSRQYQGQLESRIHEEQAANQQILDHCAWLESIIKNSEQTRLQREPTLTPLMGNQRILHRDLILARQKVEELESRIANQKLVNEILLHSVAPDHGDQLEASNIHHIRLQNHWQRGMISTLQNMLQMREETIKGLQMALDETYGVNSPSCPTCDIDSYQSNVNQGTLSPKFLDEDEETLCEPDTVKSQHRVA